MARVDRAVTSGTFSIDGEDFAVDNNIWIVGDDDEVLVIDAAHDAGADRGAVGGRRVVAIVCTHGHNDHINAAVEVADATGAPIGLHPDDLMLWDARPPRPCARRRPADGARISVGGIDLTVLHTPGHSPGGVCLHDAAAEACCSRGDTLFKGGPGATGRSFSDSPTIIAASATGCSPCPATRSCTPATATTPRSAPRRRVQAEISGDVGAG